MELSLSWTIHPIKTNLTKSIILILLIILIALLTYLSFDNILFMIVAAGLLLISLRQFFIRTHYTLDAEGVKIRFLGTETKRPWRYFRSFYEDKNGILLSPFEEKNYLEGFRGVYLILPPAPLEAKAREDNNISENLTSHSKNASNGLRSPENLLPQQERDKILSFIKQFISNEVNQ